MSDTLTADAGTRPIRPFAAQHPWDRNFFLLLVALCWLGVIVGFGWGIVRHVHAGKPPYLPVVYVHGVVFVGWLALLTAQLLLVRAQRVDRHRRLGMFGVWLAAIMVPLALGTSWLVERSHRGTDEADPAFFAIQIGIMVCFAALVAFAYRLRGQPSAHKRLMLLASIYLACVAGYSRWWEYAVGDIFGPGFASTFVSLNIGPDVLIAALGAYDLRTRGRLHPAYVAGALGLLAMQVFMNWLYFDPGWAKIARWLTGY